MFLTEVLNNVNIAEPDNQVNRGPSDDSLEFILDMIQRFVKPAENQLMEVTAQKQKRKLGILKGKKLIADGYDLDECNDEMLKCSG